MTRYSYCPVFIRFLSLHSVGIATRTWRWYELCSRSRVRSLTSRSDNHRSRRSSSHIYRERRDSIVPLVPSITSGSFVFHLTIVRSSNETWSTGESQLVNALRTTERFACRWKTNFSRLVRWCEKRTSDQREENVEIRNALKRWVSSNSNHGRPSTVVFWVCIFLIEDRVRTNEQIQRADEIVHEKSAKLQRITSFVVNSVRLCQPNEMI